jgi:Glycosyl hydrolase catalytic core
MHTASDTRRTRWNRCLTYALSGSILLAAPSAASAAQARHTTAHNSRAVAFVSRTQPRALMSASKSAARDDRALVSDAKSLRRCIQAHPGRCAAARKSLQHAGALLAKAERHFSHLAGATGRSNSGAKAASAWQGVREAPKLTVSGQTLSWNKVDGVATYLLVRRVPGQAPQDSIVNGTSVTPPPVPGVTVHYNVRTTANWSAWSQEVAISYPKASEPVSAPETPKTPKTVESVKAPDTQSAPQLTVSGQKLSWNAISGISTYVLDTKAPGQADQYTEVTGTSVTPAAIAGETVHYSVRTAVEGSAWSTEAAISFPAAKESTPPKKEEAPVQSAPAGPFTMGVNAGTSTFELPYIQTVAAKTVRMDIGITSSVTEVESLVEFYAKQGIRLLLLAGFEDRVASPAETANVANWAAAVGPGGTFWKGKSMPANTAVTDIEFGNETSYTYQFSNNSSSAYAARAQEYALRFREAANQVKAVNPNVGLLAQGDSGGNGPAWVNNMFAAVPELAQLAAGFTVHPYGSNGMGRLEELISQTAANGASNVPVWITEWGLASDNGNCLSDNYGFNKCMTYAEAATQLTSSMASIRAKLGGRLAAFYLYHVRDQKASGTSTEREAYFGALQSNGATKGAYTTTVQSLIAANS